MLYLIRQTKGKIGKKAKAHYWDGMDTMCRMASTGGLKIERYSVFDSPMEKDICTMCKSVWGLHKCIECKNHSKGKCLHYYQAGFTVEITEKTEYRCVHYQKVEQLTCDEIAAI